MSSRYGAGNAWHTLGTSKHAWVKWIWTELIVLHCHPCFVRSPHRGRYTTDGSRNQVRPASPFLSPLARAHTGTPCSSPSQNWAKNALHFLVRSGRGRGKREKMRRGGAEEGASAPQHSVESWLLSMAVLLFTGWPGGWGCDSVQKAQAQRSRQGGEPFSETNSRVTPPECVRMKRGRDLLWRPRSGNRTLAGVLPSRIHKTQSEA